MVKDSRARPCVLRRQNKEALSKTLVELKTELAGLRVAKVTGGAASKLAKIKVVRRSVARVLTVMNMKQKQQLRSLYQGASHKPKELRVKATRAVRRRLSYHQAKAVTVRQHKQQTAFPQRKFALKL
eukprot:TRINITY_DN8701_c0_g2_i1.p2 TRINITY_DN8701_c0_g2~~TRINITY_DN8701_c0_g2_i1.p2  ORF type:complete len:127 (+),score=47.76 TRINITY_DN8701_c0_g2_i1:71-451(+)